MVWDLAWKLDQIFRLSPGPILAWNFSMQIFMIKFDIKSIQATLGRKIFFGFTLLLFSFFMLFRGKYAIKFWLFTHYASDQNMHV